MSAGYLCNKYPDLMSWVISSTSFKSFLASGHFCYLLITFANSLDPDQDRQNVGPDLVPNHLPLW